MLSTAAVSLLSRTRTRRCSWAGGLSSDVHTSFGLRDNLRQPEHTKSALITTSPLKDKDAVFARLMENDPGSIVRQVTICRDDETAPLLSPDWPHIQPTLIVIREMQRIFKMVCYAWSATSHTTLDSHRALHLLD
jgi:hypothetical protein